MPKSPRGRLNSLPSLSRRRKVQVTQPLDRRLLANARFFNLLSRVWRAVDAPASAGLTHATESLRPTAAPARLTSDLTTLRVCCSQVSSAWLRQCSARGVAENLQPRYEYDSYEVDVLSARRRRSRSTGRFLGT